MRLGNGGGGGGEKKGGGEKRVGAMEEGVRGKVVVVRVQVAQCKSLSEG